MKAAVLVNGVPASGKSTVAKALAGATGWPLLALDTIKEAFFAHLGTGDRAYNRLLGRASYDAIFAAVSDFPDGVTVIVDAWFGFQPIELLHANLARAKITAIAELWCHAPPQIIGERYKTRLGQRSAGHLGADYVPELTALAARARPLGVFPVYEIDTTAPLEIDRIAAWTRDALAQPAGAQARR
jgi:predicted kinase